jgi:tetratricopeptide (TPR) repeat protein
MLALWGAAPGAGAQEVADPLAGEDHGREALDSILPIWTMRSADQALRLGFSSLAAAGYKELLASLPDDDPKVHRMSLALISALISEGDLVEARERISSYRGGKNAEYLLRRALLDWQDRAWDRVEEALGQIEPEDLPTHERAWYFFLTALASDQRGEEEASEAAHTRALQDAVSPNQRAYFLLGQYQTRLFAGDASEDLATRLKSQMESFDGRVAGFRFAQQYAVVLDLLGRKQEATQLIREQIQKVPAVERELRDQFLLLDGLISGSDGGQGRASLRELLETGGQRTLQRIALQKLAGSVSGDNSEAYSLLLSRLIEARHPLVEELRLLRAQLRLSEAAKSEPSDGRTALFQLASEDAQAILTQFPGSRLKKESFEILAASAWQQRRYRTAANHLLQLRTELPAGQRRSEVGLLVADCYFRAGEVNRAVEDYRNAADAYGAVLREHPASVSPGLILYQRVLSEIRGGRVDEVLRHMREIPEGVTIEPIYRWQSEWNLVKAMQRAGRMAEAYERVTELLTGSEESVPEGDLQIRLEWLRAQLSFDAGRPAETLPLVEAVLASLESEPSPVPQALAERITAYSLLLQAQAQLGLDQAEAATATLEMIRDRFPGSEPASYSYLVEARHYTRINRTVDAQQLLISLADNQKESRYAPIALYEAALNAQRRGQEADYQNQAIQLLERLVNQYPGHELAFYARLRQGDLLRQLNRFEAAEGVYKFVENNFPNHPDLALARLSLADSYLAQANGQETQSFRDAVAILERLFDLSSLGPDLRAEAGFKLAFANATRGRVARAQEVYWAAVSVLYLDEATAQSLGSRGRYWIARSLFEYGQLFEREGRPRDARDAYSLIARNALPGEALARANLARLSLNGEPE